MPVPVVSALRRLLRAAGLAVLLAGCAGTRGAADLPELPAVELAGGRSVHVSVSGPEPPSADLASLISASLQSERGLRLADSEREADAVVRVRIRDIFVADVSRQIVDPGAAFGRGATGTVLGATVGSLAGGRDGALWGALGGAALGLGVAVHESGGARNIWALKAEVSIAPRGATPAPSEIVARSRPAERREDALPDLEDVLARAIVNAVRAPSRD